MENSLYKQKLVVGIRVSADLSTQKLSQVVKLYLPEYIQVHQKVGHARDLDRILISRVQYNRGTRSCTLFYCQNIISVESQLFEV